MKRWLIVIGGTVHLTPLLQRQMAESRTDRIVAADSGLNWTWKLGLQPDRMLGDFDSVSPEILQFYQNQQIPMQTYPSRKDYTDSELALWSVLDEAQPGDEIRILGGIGSRMDHTLANIFLLQEALRKGVKAQLIDGLNEIELLEGPCERIYARRREQQYFSILPYLGAAEGIDLEGFAYPLHQYTIQPGQCIGISNEIPQEQAVLRLRKGYLLVIRSTNDTPSGESSIFSEEK